MALDLTGFIPVKSTRAHKPTVGKDGDLHFPISYLTQIGFTAPPKGHVRVSYNPQTRQAALAILEEPETGALALSQANRAGSSVRLSKLFATFGLFYQKGVVEVQWHAPEKTWVVDLSPILTEAPRNGRDVTPNAGRLQKLKELRAGVPG